MDTYYIVGFEPNATMDTAHHIILYGCSKPGSSKPLWNCGEMSHSSDASMTIASPCEDDSEVCINPHSPHTRIHTHAGAQARTYTHEYDVIYKVFQYSFPSLIGYRT